MTGIALWYLNRATGITSLVLMTLTVVLGSLVRRHGRIPGLPRFAVQGLHRNVGLLSALLLVTHVGTAIVDSYVNIGVSSTFVPFVSGYRPFAIGLGTLAVDLLLLVVATSLLRNRLALWLWKAVHLTSYLLWPLAFVHGITAGTDLGGGWLLVLVLGCAAIVMVPAFIRAWRLSEEDEDQGKTPDEDTEDADDEAETEDEAAKPMAAASGRR